MSDRERLLTIIQSKALEVRKVTLSSGRTSDYYVDCRRVTLDSEGAYLTAKLMLELLDEEVSAVGGMTLGADPIVSSMAVLSHVQGKGIAALIVRKEPKKHGTMNYIEGPVLEKGSKVAVVDDVVTSGASLLKAIERIAAEGYEPVQAMALLDRMEGGREALVEAGYGLDCIFARKDLMIDRQGKG